MHFNGSKVRSALILAVCAGMIFAGAVSALPSSQKSAESMFGTNSEAMQDSFEKAVSDRTQNVNQQLQKKFEEDVDRIIRSQDDFERNMAVQSQNLQDKKHLTRKEKKKLLDNYTPMPKTLEEYNEMSKDIKRSERRIPEPKADEDEKLVKIPQPRYILAKYNDPPGSKNIDLRNLRNTRQINSIGVISPSKDKLAYSTVYYTGYNDKISSEIYYINLDKGKNLKSAAKSASVMNKQEIKLLESGMKEEYPTLFKTLTVLDWNADGTKIAVKERIGSSTFGIWQTNLWVYDLNANKAKRLVEVRDAIKYWWQTNKNFNVDDYRWDIVPIGWDTENPDTLFVCAYAYTTKKTTKFLGIFSVDSKGQHSELVSIAPRSLAVSANGLVLKPVLD